MALYAKGPRKVVLLIENLMKSPSEMLMERRNGNDRLPWGTDGKLMTRSYKKELEGEICTIQFVYESRDEDTGSIVVTGANGIDRLNSLIKCVPDVKGGISELFIGEKIMAKAEVFKDGKGLEVGLHCPFCKSRVDHQCQEAKKV